jgi:hypothetical protein
MDTARGQAGSEAFVAAAMSRDPSCVRRSDMASSA